MSQLSTMQKDLLGGLATVPFWRVIAGANRELYAGFEEYDARKAYRDAIDGGALDSGEVAIYRDNQLVDIAAKDETELADPSQGDPARGVDFDEAVQSLYDEREAESTALTEQSRAEMKSDIEEVAKSYYNTGVSVEIDRQLSSVAVDGPGIDLFVQGEEAEELIDDADSAASKFNVDEQDWIIFMLDSSGAF